MSYDDDGSLLRFQEFEDLAVLLERYLSAPENLTVVRALAVTQAIHVALAGRSLEKTNISELSAALRQKGLATLPFGTVVRIGEFVGRISAEKDVLAHVSLRDLQRIVQT